MSPTSEFSWLYPPFGGCGFVFVSPEWRGQIAIAMPPDYDLIHEWNGAQRTKTIEAEDAESAWRVGIASHVGCLKAVVCLEPCTDSVEVD